MSGGIWMLKLENIKKDYITGDTAVHALKGVSVEFAKANLYRYSVSRAAERRRCLIS